MPSGILELTFDIGLDSSPLHLLTINPLPQLPGTFERHNPPWYQHHVFTSSRVPASAFSLLIHAELTEPRNEDIFTGCQIGLD